MYGLVWCFLVIVLICWGGCLGRFGCVNRLFIGRLSLGLGLLCCCLFCLLVCVCACDWINLVCLNVGCLVYGWLLTL